MFESRSQIIMPAGLGLIGFGGFGQFIADVFSEMPQARLRAVCDADAARRKLAAERYGVRTFENPLELIELPEVEVVVISTPPNTHAPLGIAAAQKGKAVFCEKPLATTFEDAARLIQTAQENSAALIVDFVQRYNPLNEAVRDLVRERVLGRLVNMEVTNYASDEFLKPGHWFWDRQISGGIWVEHGVHFFDLAAWWMDSPAACVTALASNRPNGEEDRVWAIVRHQDGSTATFCHTFTQPAAFEQTSIRLAFSRGYVTLEGWIPTRLLLRAMVNQSELDYLEGRFECIPAKLAMLKEENCCGWASGEEYEVKYEAEFEVELSEGKQAVYRQCVARAMLDLLELTRTPGFTPRVTAQDGLLALQTALAAGRAAQEGCRMDV